MPTWFYNRPAEQADPTEALVAEVFNRLPGKWFIRWGYFYERKNHAGLKDKEGDFILLGPDGRILVVEVKSGQNRHFVLTGEWEHGDDNPATQLAGEWNAVIDALGAAYDGRVPYVGKALCLPHVNLTEQDRLQGEFSREQLIFKQDLEDMEGWWNRYLAKCPTHCKEPVKAFHAALAKGLKPAAMKLFLKQSDLLFDRFKATEFEILTMLRGNRQWMVEGGVGTGKTFLALQQAIWLAEHGDGQEVLFLAYNLLLAERLEKMVARLKLKRGRIVVRSWEALLDEIISIEGMGLEVPEDKSARFGYFAEELPTYVKMVIDEGKLKPMYDALVVDEAQDHNTRFVKISAEAGSLGWWSWYFALLHEGNSAQVAIFYDEAQRPAFRGAEGFDPKKLRTGLTQAVHVKLRKTLRYTRPILDYLKALEAPGTKRLCANLMPHESLPTGLEVSTLQAERSGTAQAVESILQDWKQKGLCQPKDVVVISPRKWLKNSSLGEVDTLCGFPLQDYSEDVQGAVTYIGAHRSKGMDFLAVILIDFPLFEALAADAERLDLQEAFFLGASRSRQLLAVVETA